MCCLRLRAVSSVLFLPQSLAQGTSCKDPANVAPNQVVDVIKCSGYLNYLWLVIYEINIL